ncbi:hypothetical protein SDRG_16382 [Saprolegnia diclina VS20]|uniref:Nucleotide-diphospho-sugar transferase domain-containing protein n=1 Tax=Saprolegnia diclina (strain VS20) TaxID=1156394 RepID=T0PU60_SAPDV|nr:hypothetical protein SDRG_16382 [Saprolegnia diclina VS20]EQC25786.1 hypothetical protein SDRG_16382 [Saprolegnia diclina VS20]|eukprot:XP_008620811.1 hypothetical protein SDRG_16382 [Saprolegnia diclina VS20]
MLYATNSITACSALIMADSIRRLGTPASVDVAVLVTGSISQNIHDALTAGGLVVIPVASWRQPSAPHDTWVESLTKLRIFEEHGYDRVIYLDSDAWLQRNLDHLFYLGEAVFWAPRAYWLDQPFIASTLLVLTPSNALFRRLEKTVAENPGKEMYDMDALNVAFKNEYGMLPSHYVCLNSEVNNRDKMLGFASVDERINKTYVHHYSMMDNGGYGKPWRMNRHAMVRRPEWHPLFYTLFEMYYERQDALCHF